MKTLYENDSGKFMKSLKLLFENQFFIGEALP